MKTKKLITIGIPTCYGGKSLITTVKSILKNKGNFELEIIIQADRTPIEIKVKQTLQELGAKLYWNEVEGSQFKKLNQIIKKAKGEIFIFTQDDITFDPQTINEIIKTFNQSRAITMVGSRVLPLKPLSVFESGVAALVKIVDNVGREWNQGDNHLMASGRCLSFRTKLLKNYNIPDNIVTGDAYLYLENKRLGGKFTYANQGIVFIRCPQNFKDQLGPSSRYQYSLQELRKYFNDVEKEYEIPVLILVKYCLLGFIKEPIPTIFYLYIFAVTRLKRKANKEVSNPVWKVDISTKKII